MTSRKTTSVAKKKQPVVTAPVLKELAVAQVSSSTQKAASGMCIASGGETCPPVSATMSSTSRASTSAPTLATHVDKGMCACYYYALLTALTGNPAPVATMPDFLWNANPDVIARYMALTGEYSPCLCTTR